MGREQKGGMARPQRKAISEILSEPRRAGGGLVPALAHRDLTTLPRHA